LSKRKSGEYFILETCRFLYSQSKAIEGTIEEMLVRLDEFSHLADTVRSSDTELSFRGF